VKFVIGRRRRAVDADALGQGLFVARWENGDRFQPLGMSEAKKLQDFFVDEKCRGGDVVVCRWVRGGRSYRVGRDIELPSRSR